MKLMLLPLVVICLKNCTFVVSTTTKTCRRVLGYVLWFAWKIVPLWYQQQHRTQTAAPQQGCDLLEKLYLCGINNNTVFKSKAAILLWFAWKIVPLWYQQQQTETAISFPKSCDLLEKLYLCGINNNLYYIIIW